MKNALFTAAEWLLGGMGFIMAVTAGFCIGRGNDWPSFVAFAIASGVSYALADRLRYSRKNIELMALTTALKDCMSTFQNEVGQETIVTTERQEAWMHALKQYGHK